MLISHVNEGRVVLHPVNSARAVFGPKRATTKMSESSCFACQFVHVAHVLQCPGSLTLQDGNAFQVKGAIANAAISAAPLSEGFCNCLREFQSVVLCYEFMSGSPRLW